MRYIVKLVLVVGCWVLVACSSTPTDVTMSDQLPSIYPDYIGVTIPDGIAPMNFNIRSNDEVEAVDVVVKGSKGGELHANGDWARFDVDQWHALTAANKGGELTFTVCVKQNGKWLQYKDFKMYVSKYDLAEWGLTYRRIAWDMRCTAIWESFSVTCLTLRRRLLSRTPNCWVSV